MTRRPFSTSPNHLQYVRGLHRLHELTVKNQDDSPEADLVRDTLDQPWFELSEVERKRVDGLSEDLYSVSDLPEQSLPINPQFQRKLIEAWEARDAGEWDKALELYRRWKRHF